MGCQHGGFGLLYLFSVYSGVLVIWVERGGQPRASGTQGGGKGWAWWLSTMLIAPSFRGPFACQPSQANQPNQAARLRVFCHCLHTHTLTHTLTTPSYLWCENYSSFFIFSIDGAGGTSFSTYLCCSFYLFVSTASKESNRMLRWFCSHTYARDFLMIWYACALCES